MCLRESVGRMIFSLRENYNLENSFFFNGNKMQLKTRSGPNRPAAVIGGGDSLGHLAFELVDRRLR